MEGSFAGGSMENAANFRPTSQIAGENRGFRLSAAGARKLLREVCIALPRERRLAVPARPLGKLRR